MLKLNSNKLKLVAIICMALDHFAMVFFYRRVEIMPLCPRNIFYFYYICRILGRLALPIFIFLMSEGYRYTKDKKKYLIRLFIFAIISEIPYNLADAKRFFFPLEQNILFTLGLSFLNLWLVDTVNKKISYNIKFTYTVKNIFIILSTIIITFLSCVISEKLYFSYGSSCVISLLICFYLKKYRALSVFLMTILLMIWVYLYMTRRTIIFGFWHYAEVYSILSLIPIMLYDETLPNKKYKYIFYIFYPAHLLIFYLLSLIR